MLHKLTNLLDFEYSLFSSKCSYFSAGTDPLQFTFISYLICFLTTHSWSDTNDKDTSSQRTPSHQRTQTGLIGMLQFFFVTGLLAVVGSRVASLVVLEFCLRGVSGWVTAGPVRNQLHNKNYNKQPIICFVSSISSVHMLLYSPGVQEISAAAVSSKPVLSGLCPELQFAFSPRGGIPSLVMPAPGSSTELAPG